MTHTVAATTSAVATADAHRATSARAASTSFAQVQAAAVKSADSDKGTSSSSDATTTVPKGEKTQSVKGHSYKEIVSGPRNGMFINNTGNRRDGEAFLIVKRHGREFHIYGSGDDRTVYEVGRKRDADTPTTTDSSTTTTGTAGTTTSGTTGTTGTASETATT